MAATVGEFILPKEGKARGVQIDVAARRASLRYPMEVNLIGGSVETLRALIPLLKRNEDRSWRKKIQDSVADWWKVLEARAMMPARPLNPQRLFWELSPRLPDNVILSSDSGSAALGSALLKGDAGWRGIVRQTYRDMLASRKPHRGWQPQGDTR